MDLGPMNWLWIVPVLGLLVFVHELGHFVTARMNGIRVDEFGFGFPPRLFGIKRGGVIYSINAIPVGGFVRIYGENGEGAEEPYAFGAKKPWQRALVLSAGSAMNVLLAVIIFFGMAMTTGLPTEQGVIIGDVMQNSPAATAGMRSGDKIREIGGVAINGPDDVRPAIDPWLDKEVTFIIERDGERISTSITPRSPANRPASQGAIGISLAADVVNKTYDPVGAVGAAVRHAARFVGLMITGIGDLITGQVGWDGVAGPVGIGQATSEIVGSGGFSLLLNWTALLSLNLFLVNMLPLPALDGGRLVFVLLEAVRGKKVAPQREALVHATGMILLLSFLVIISFFDVQRIIGGDRFLRRP